MIGFCGCSLDSVATKFQDALYGVGRRVFTEKVGGASAVCTICGKAKSISKAEAAEVKTVAAVKTSSEDKDKKPEHKGKKK